MFIDKKGRLFGVINIIDLLVVFIVLSIIPAYYFAHQAIQINTPNYKNLQEIKQLTILYKDRLEKEQKFIREYPKYKKHFK